jgi:hypothetical protein
MQFDKILQVILSEIISPKFVYSDRVKTDTVT